MAAGGTQEREKAIRASPSACPKRHPKFDDGYRPHQTEVWPDHPDRAYVAYIDGGAIILDISGLAAVKAGRATTFVPKVVGKAQFSPPYTAWTHTFQPIFSRGMALVSDEDTQDNCKDAPKLVWLLDIRAETNPMVIATAPLHSNDGELCGRGGRFGAHNLHPNFPESDFGQSEKHYCSQLVQRRRPNLPHRRRPEGRSRMPRPTWRKLAIISRLRQRKTRRQPARSTTPSWTKTA